MVVGEGSTLYLLDITTGDEDGASATGEVGVRVADRLGRRTVEQRLGKAHHDVLERGCTDRHFVLCPQHFAEPVEVHLRLTRGQHWLVHEIRLTTVDGDLSYSSGSKDLWLTSELTTMILPVVPDELLRCELYMRSDTS